MYGSWLTYLSLSSFFRGYLPMDYQTSCSKAMRPTNVSQLAIFLASFALAQGSNTTTDQIDQATSLKLLNWDENQVLAPRWALLSDSYAASSSSSPSPVVWLLPFCRAPPQLTLFPNYESRERPTPIPKAKARTSATRPS